MEKYISIKVILDNILDHPLLRDIPFERVVNYTVNFIRIVGMPKAFEEKVAILEVRDYRVELPCDFNSIILVRTTKECDHSHNVFRAATDSFHMSKDKHGSYDLTYKIQGNIIYTSIKDGIIEVAYRAIVTDSDGYPMIPDNSSFIRALELYIKKLYFTVLFDLGKINQAVYNNVCLEYAWAVGQAQSDLVRPTIDEMLAFTNSINTLIPRVREHSSGFINNGTLEKIRLQ